MGDAADLKEFMQHLRLHDLGAVDQIEGFRDTIANLLPSTTLRNPERITSEGPDTIELQDQYIAHRCRSVN